MKPSDVIHGRIVTLDLRRRGVEPFPEALNQGAEAFLLIDDRDEVRLKAGEQTWPVEGVTSRDQDALRQVAIRNLPRLSWIVQRSPDRGPPERILLQVHEFPSSFVWNEPAEFGVTDKVVDDLRKRRRRLISVESAVQWLTETVLLHPRQLGDAPRALLSGTPAATTGKKTAFRLYGSGFAVDIEANAEGRLLVTRVVEARRAVEGAEHRAVYMVTGQLSFCDATVAGLFRGIARTEIDNLVAQADSYLGLWRDYNDREMAGILRRARQFGWVGYSAATALNDGAWRFQLTLDAEGIRSTLQRLNDLDGDQLEAGLVVPASIQGVDGGDTKKGRKLPFVGTVVDQRALPPSISLRPSSEHEGRTPPQQGFLFVALGGDEIRIARRTSAWTRVRSCTNPMSQLGMIIEGQAVPERHGSTLKPITKAVRDVFANPNDMQREAIRIALNTPDIALIQGPPGTGKTRVIAALQARLAEKDEGIDPDGIAGSTLLTSFQHDAVENAAAATRVMGLPAVKIGHRRGDAESRDGVELWAADTAQSVRAARAIHGREDSIHTALRRVREQVIAHLQSPSSTDETASVLRSVSDLANAWLPGQLINEIANLQSGMGSVTGRSLVEDDREFALRAVRSIRTDPVSFGDDGPLNAHKALRRLGGLSGFVVTTGETECLELAAAHAPSEPVDAELLARLATVRDGLVDRLRPNANEDGPPKVHAEAETLLMRVLDALSERARETATGVDVAVDDWLSELDHDPEGIREAVQHYTMVLAATCQQSVGREMEEAKLGADTVFRSVIVDEAARSNPLDLLIPMALAERRIVLVGDHRQLPHILEPDVERELEHSIRDETRDALKKSLFERLFRDLQERERRDGVKRTVTLNVQYRMHQTLGQFVSKQFYEPHGEGFTSVRPDSDFAHDLRLGQHDASGKVGAWLNLPVGKGQESPGRSKSRAVEARRVAEEALAVLTTQPNLTVGVITFYAAQRDALLEAMVPVGLAEPDDAGGRRIRDVWRRTPDGRERLRVGTVDAFQGKEFDVVFLSLTRSNKLQVKDEVTRRRKYGFLLLENRLCVAMSRQHRMLVVVGDIDMARGPDAEQSVPGLVAFRKLCEGPHGITV